MLAAGEWLVDWSIPQGLVFDEWANFLKVSPVLLFMVAIAIFLSYRFLAHRFVHITTWDTVYNLRRPWLLGLLTVPVVYFVVTLLISFIALSGYSLGALIGVFFVWFFTAPFGMIIYWLLSLWSYPARGKYFAFLKWWR